MTFEIHKYRKTIILLFAIVPTIALSKYFFRSWWDIIEIDNYLDHLYMRNPGLTICFYEPPSLISLLIIALLTTIVTAIPLLILTYKKWTYLVYKIFLIIIFSTSLGAMFYTIYTDNLLNYKFTWTSKDTSTVLLPMALALTSIISWYSLKLWNRLAIKQLFDKKTASNNG